MILKVSSTVVFLLLISVVAFTLSCGTTDNERRTDLLTETVIEPGADDSADMDTGTRVLFPDGCFTENTIVLISDELASDELDAALFPEGALTVLSAIILNTPVDTIFRKNITYTWVLLTAVEPGTAYKIYRFNEYYENPEEAWVELQGVTAQADTTGTYAYSVMPSSGVAGYSGTFVLFVEKPADIEPNTPPEFVADGLHSNTETYIADTVIVFSSGVTDADGDTLSFIWNDGNADHGEFTNQTFADGTVSTFWTTDAAGTYTITLTVQDEAGAIVTDTLDISVG
jgi:hypothetical protein